jgi:phage gp16-like protein
VSSYVVDKDGARKADLARIHIAKKALNLDDETYRDIMFAVARVRSSAQLDFTGRKRLIEHFLKCGWDGSKGQPGNGPKRATKAPRRPTPSAAMAPMCSKVRAQLISLGRRPDSYADAIAKRMFKVDFYEWLESDQLHALIAALAIEQAASGVAYHPRVKPRSQGPLPAPKKQPENGPV